MCQERIVLSTCEKVMMNRSSAYMKTPCSIMDWLIIGLYVEKVFGREHSLVAGNSSVVSICFIRYSAPHRIFGLTAGSE